MLLGIIPIDFDNSIVSVSLLLYTLWLKKKLFVKKSTSPGFILCVFVYISP